MIKKLAALVAILILFTPPSFPQIPCTNVPIPCERLKLREVELQVLINLEKQNAHAIQLNNPSFFQDVYADDFSGFTWYGLAVNKYKLIQLVQTSGEKYQVAIASDIDVKMFLDSASVMSLRTERGSRGDKEFSRQFRVLRVYVYSARGWKIVSQIETQLPATIAR